MRGYLSRPIIGGSRLSKSLPSSLEWLMIGPPAVYAIEPKNPLDRRRSFGWAAGVLSLASTRHCVIVTSLMALVPTAVVGAVVP